MTLRTSFQQGLKQAIMQARRGLGDSGNGVSRPPNRRAEEKHHGGTDTPRSVQDGRGRGSRNRRGLALGTGVGIVLKPGPGAGPRPHGTAGMRHPDGERDGGRTAEMRWSQVYLARTARAVRRQWPDRNPLRRTIDRVEDAVGVGLTVAILAGAPLAAIAAGHFASGIGSRAAHAQQAVRHQMPAVPLAPVPVSGSDQNQISPTWAAPGGRRRTGHIPVPLDARAATGMIWVDVAGRLSGRRPEVRRMPGQPELAPVFAFLAVGVIVLCVGQLAYGALDRRRLAAWEADWRATEPHWTGRR
jgi:hypothetical protein